MGKAVIVDDSPVMRRHLKKLIEDMGHNVVEELEDGRNLCSIYGKVNPDFVTLDIVLKKTDGIEILKELIKEYPQAKVIMLSSLDTKDTVITAIQHGAKHFVIKPIDASKFQQVVKYVLGCSEQPPEGEQLLPNPLDG